MIRQMPLSTSFGCHSRRGVGALCLGHQTTRAHICMSPRAHARTQARRKQHAREMRLMEAQVLYESEQAAQLARQLADQMVALQEHHKSILDQHLENHAAALKREKEARERDRARESTSARERARASKRGRKKEKECARVLETESERETERERCCMNVRYTRKHKHARTRYTHKHTHTHTHTHRRARQASCSSR